MQHGVIQRYFEDFDTLDASLANYITTNLTRPRRQPDSSLIKILLNKNAVGRTASAAQRASVKSELEFLDTAERKQVIEAAVQLALDGQPWREICAGLLRKHAVMTEAVEREVERRWAAP